MSFEGLHRRAVEHAERLHPAPKQDSRLTGLFAGFGASLFSLLPLTIAGVDESTKHSTTAITAVVVGIAVWLWFRHQERQHWKAYSTELAALKADRKMGENNPPSAADGRQVSAD